MRLIKQLSDDVVYSNWIIHEAKGRLSSDVESLLRRYPHYRPIIEAPNLKSRFENRRRAILCWLSRGAILFELPLDVKWYRAEISEKDFKTLFVIADNWWSKHYGLGSNRLSVISNTVNLKKDLQHIQILLSNINQIDKNLIVIGRKKGPFTIIDGVHRAIALYINFLLLKREEWTPFEVYAGISEIQCAWQSNRIQDHAHTKAL